MALIAPLAVGGSYVLYGSQKQRRIVRFSFVKCGGLDFRYEGLCMYQRNSRCYELVVGPPGNLLLLRQVRKQIG